MDKNKKGRIGDKIYNELVLPFKLLGSPFKRFEDIKENKVGNFYMATIFILLVGILEIFEYQYTGFILNSFNPRKLNAIVILISATLPFFIFIVSNFAVTTFLDGKGKMGEILKIVGYSLFPFIVFKFITIMLTNFIVTDEITIIKTIYYFGIVCSVFLIFIGMITIHEYGAFRNIISFIASFIVMLVIIFISLLLINMLQKMLGFTQSFIKEVTFRIRGY